MVEKDRRRSQRVKPTFRVRTEILPESGDIHMAVFADIINLSEAGICLRSPLKLKPQSRIIVYLPQLDSKNPMEVPGLIRWVKAAGPLMYEYGMEFAGIEKIKESLVRNEIRLIMAAFYDQRPFEFRV